MLTLFVRWVKQTGNGCFMVVLTLKSVHEAGLWVGQTFLEVRKHEKETQRETDRHPSRMAP